MTVIIFVVSMTELSSGRRFARRPHRMHRQKSDGIFEDFSAVVNAIRSGDVVAEEAALSSLVNKLLGTSHKTGDKHTVREL